MKSLYRLYFFLVLSLSVTVSQAQPSLGLSNLAGFPDVITQGTQYNVTGWIVNGTDLLHVSNNFHVANPLQPGDSVLWTENNYTFPPGQFRLGNNDVIIWSTAPSSSSTESDSLGKPIYFTNSAAFRLQNSGFEVFGEYADLDDEYTFLVDVTNEGNKKANDGIDLFVKMNWFAPVLLRHYDVEVDINETVDSTLKTSTFSMHLELVMAILRATNR
jgi:hypothetical protein